VEGHINRLKTLKRQMYGRAKVHLNEVWPNGKRIILSPPILGFYPFVQLGEVFGIGHEESNSKARNGGEDNY
jgi:hypothetical protein